MGIGSGEVDRIYVRGGGHVLSRLMFAVLRFRARRGLAQRAPADRQISPVAVKQFARGTGIRGETYAYWYLRRHGYIPIARNFMVPGVKGEIDIVGYDGATLAFVEVKTRVFEASARNAQPPPEEGVNWTKRRNMVRMARQFLRIRRLEPVSYRFDVVAIECLEGMRPQVRLYKGAFSGGW